MSANRENIGGGGGGLRACARAVRRAREHAGRHRGVGAVAPVFWASFTVFVHSGWGLAGFALHAFFVWPGRAAGRFALPCAYVLLGLWFAAREPYVSLDGAPFHRRFIAEAEDAPPTTRTGRVVSVPAPTARGHVFLFRERREDGARGLLYRATLETAEAPAWGEVVRVTGRAGPAEAPPNPGQLDMRRVLRGQGASAALQAARSETVAPAPPWNRALTTAREALAASLARHVPEPARPLLEASLLNLTGNVSEETRDAFLRSGMQHILAISGQHIGLLLGFLLIAGLCARLPRKATFLLAAALTAAYIPLVGAPVSVVRSGLMFACLIPAIMLERPTAGLHALGLTASADLLLDPHNILNLGFQLSYAATLALILGARPAQQAGERATQGLAGALRRMTRSAAAGGIHACRGIVRLLRLRASAPHTADQADADEAECGDEPEPPPRRGTHPGRGRLKTAAAAVLQMIVLSALITLFTYPVLAASTHATTPWGVVGNVATVPVGAAMLVGGLFTWSFDFLLPASFDPLAAAAGAAAGFCALLLEGLVFFLADLPGALRPVAHAPAAWLVALTTAAALATLLLRRQRYAAAMLCALATLAAEAARPAAERAWSGGPRVTFLAVGHGDAAVLELPGANILIDAGDSPRVSRNIILPFLQYRGIARLDAVLITHPDRDHYGGVAALLSRVPVDRIVVPPETRAPGRSSATWDCVRATARGLAIPWVTAQAGQRLYTGRRDTLWLIAPDTTQPALAGADKNDRSLVALLLTRGPAVLFTGDIEHPGQRALAATWPLWRGAWLKAPHHGSDRTTRPCFLHAAAPPRAVVSCGGRRGFPGTRVMETLDDLGTRTAVTKHHGAVTWMLGRDGPRETRHLAPVAPSGF